MSNTYNFVPSDTDTLEDWALQIHNMYLPKKKVKMSIDMSKCSVLNIKKMIGLKCVLDSYRPLTKKFLVDTTIHVQDPLLKNFIRSVLVFFKPEKPVYIV